MHRETLTTQFELSKYVLTSNLDGLTHEDSLVQPTPGGNCLNWVVGHIVRARNMALTVMGQNPAQSLDMFDAYEKNPITDGRHAIAFEELIDYYDATQQALASGLRAMTPDALSAQAPFSPTSNPNETVGSLLASFAFHEAYHAGQTGVLRRIAGGEGAIKSPS